MTTQGSPPPRSSRDRNPMRPPVTDNEHLLHPLRGNRLSPQPHAISCNANHSQQARRAGNSRFSVGNLTSCHLIGPISRAAPAEAANLVSESHFIQDGEMLISPYTPVPPNDLPCDQKKDPSRL